MTTTLRISSQLCSLSLEIEDVQLKATSYIRKLSDDIDDFFQQPHPAVYPQYSKWYKAQPVGVNKIGKFLSEISKAAGLNHIYTNHSIWGTTVNAMKN